MSRLTKSEQRELLNTQLNVEENQSKENYLKNDELLKQLDIPNTPFKVVGNYEDGFFIALGKYRVTEVFDVEDKYNDEDLRDLASDLLLKDIWNVVFKMILTHSVVLEEVKKDAIKLQEQE